MNLLEVKGLWNVARGKVKQSLAALLRNDQQFMEGKVNELIGRIQQRTGQTRGKRCQQK